MADTVPVTQAASTAAVTSDIRPQQSGQVASVATGATVSVWVLDLASAATVGATVLATQSGVGRWLLAGQYSTTTPLSEDELWPASVDGTRTSSSGGADPSPLASPTCYSTLTISTAGTTLSMAGNRLIVTDTLTVNASCALHNDGSSATGQPGGAGASVGEMGFGSAIPGANGGNLNSTGGSVAAVAAVALGGSGGAGGASGDGAAGGAAPAATAPVATAVGTPWTRLALEYLGAVLGTTVSKCRGGAGGAGGGGSFTGVGAGGGGGGGLGWIRAKNVVNNGRISCRGGNGFNASVLNSGGGGGGGGGCLVIWCDTWTGNAPDCNGGTGGTGNGTGVAGSSGSAGKVLVFVRGLLAYRSGFGANAPDINLL